ncbi:hypothetical protein ACFL2G_04505 [Candidatus Omnitrophota bacterium]
MNRTTKFFAVILFVVVCLGISSIAEEITLTTYYPAPYGAYEELIVTGNVGVGTTSPQTALDVTSGAVDHTAIRIENTESANGVWELRSNQQPSSLNNGFSIWGGTEGSEDYRLCIRSNGDVGIGTTGPASKLDVDGDVNAVSYSTGGTSGASGTFTTLDGKTVTVTNGIITNITP